MASTRTPAQRVMDSGRRSVAAEWRDARDRFVASDPGLGRLRHGIRAVVALTTTIGVQLLVSAALGTNAADARLHVMLGAILAMNLATTMRDTRRREIARTSTAAAAGAMIGVASAILTESWPVLAFAAFVIVTFVAVWLRRFGPRWFTAGFVMWQAHFFGLFLQPPASELPGILVAAVISTIWVAVLLSTVLAADPEATLRRTVTSLRAQARAVLSACLDLLKHPASESDRRELRSQLIKTNEMALFFDGQLADARALPDGVSALVLRQWIIDVEIGVDEVAGAVRDLITEQDRERAGGRDDSGRDVSGGDIRHTRRAMERALVELGWSRFDEARAAIAALRVDEHWQRHAARRFVNGAELLLRSVEDWTSGAVLERARAAEAGDFEAVVRLQGGSLPGSQALAGEALTHDQAHWWSPGRMVLTTRQAIQAATAAGLALLAGGLIAPNRSYWAAIAAFITFTGASTTSETARKAIDRTVGTLIGLVVSLGLAHVLAARPAVSVAIMLIGIFLAFYVQALSTTWMICLFTVVLGQLYELLQNYSDDVLWLRLAETAAGAGAGLLVTYAVLPVAARDTLVVARRELLATLAGLLDDCAEVLTGGAATPAQRAAAYRQVVALDEAARQLAAGHDSLIRPRVFDADHAARRHRVAVLGVCASSGRSLAQAVLAAPADTAPASAEVCRVLAAEARRLADVPDLKDQRPAPADRPGIAARVADLLAGAHASPVVLSRRSQRLADALALLTPRRR